MRDSGAQMGAEIEMDRSAASNATTLHRLTKRSFA
jgi:hypothetical protein